MFTLKRTVHVLDENTFGPEAMTIKITEELAKRILQLSRAVKSLKVDSIKEFNYLPDFFDIDYDKEEKPLIDTSYGVECNSLNVTDSSFYWSGYIKHTDVRWESESILIKMLEEMIKVYKAPLKDLPLLINSESMYNDVKELVKNRLKNH